MTFGIPHKSDNSNTTLERLRERVLGGAYILLDTLTEDELVAMQSMLFNDEAEIVNCVHGRLQQPGWRVSASLPLIGRHCQAPVLSVAIPGCSSHTILLGA
jgi:hypothetical protein